MFREPNAGARRRRRQGYWWNMLEYEHRGLAIDIDKVSDIQRKKNWAFKVDEVGRWLRSISISEDQRWAVSVTASEEFCVA
jgi:hypothetical protein